MTRARSTLFRPKSVAVIGGGAWCISVIDQLTKTGFEGRVWPVHPSKTDLAGRPAVARLEDLPSAPDVAFVGINRTGTIEVVRELAGMGAGSAVCFASGFSEVDDGGDLNRTLLEAAGEMPILGPNCYGFINALDGAVIWPDQHGCQPVDRGVAILTQSSNIAINLTMQSRGLPIAYVVACGNQAQMTQAQIAAELLDDPRVTAIGCHIEGFGHLADWVALARKAKQMGKPLIALKVGKSQEAQNATISHTASLAGNDAGATALLKRLGIARVDDLDVFLEALKSLHLLGPLPNNRIATVSCSGGEASLAADIAEEYGLEFPILAPDAKVRLEGTLGPKVTVSNPLDYHTYIWRDTKAMTETFAAMVDPDLAMTVLIVDYPRADTCDPSDWACATAAAIAANARTDGRLAMAASIPELMPETVAVELMEAGVLPLSGLRNAPAAIAATIKQECLDLELDLLIADPPTDLAVLTEAQAKSALQAAGLSIPRGEICTRDALTDAFANLTPPLALKGQCFAHKTENGALALGLSTGDEVTDAAKKMATDTYLLEEMIDGAVAELLIGITKDPAHGYVLTLGAGGVLTEVLKDSVSLLVPSSADAIRAALNSLACAPILHGYRGKPAVDMDAVVAAVLAVQSYVVANAGAVAEVEVNPLICTSDRAVAADALIRRRHD